ncbi:MAG: hypothetical protein R3293_27320 [Candidatus Promineifilaceae bacterium]|nr:hypothetical protein [Candidatus Promineifilaceae bacterium]
MDEWNVITQFDAMIPVVHPRLAAVPDREIPHQVGHPLCAAEDPVFGLVWSFHPQLANKLH